MVYSARKGEEGGQHLARKVHVDEKLVVGRFRRFFFRPARPAMLLISISSTTLTRKNRGATFADAAPPDDRPFLPLDAPYPGPLRLVDLSQPLSQLCKHSARVAPSIAPDDGCCILMTDLGRKWRRGHQRTEAEVAHDSCGGV